MRPFFSIVIACYNDGRYKKGNYLDNLLDNLTTQQGIANKDDLEIIVVDDNSPVSIDEFVKDYLEQGFNIRVIRRPEDASHYPGAAKQCGADHASGQWLTFIDHDDELYPLTLVKIKDAIDEKHEDFFVFGNINKVNESGEVIEKFDSETGMPFTHAKFYNLDNFWKKYKLHFPEGLETHEDIALSNQLRSAIKFAKLVVVTYLQDPLYKWLDNKDSISNTKYQDRVLEDGQKHSFLEIYFKDNARASLGQFLERFELGQISEELLILLFFDQLLRYYRIFASWKGILVEDNEEVLKHYLNKISELTNKSLNVLKVIADSYLGDLVSNTEKEVQNGFMLFLKWIDHLAAHKTIDDTEDTRPFFSVVIPCYNSGIYSEGTYIDRLLNSLCNQGLKKSELEVIISDDHSPVSYDEYVDKYRDRLNIKRITTDYNFAPGNTRAKGMTLVTGRWVCFADHDDIYYNDALRRVKEKLLESKEQYYALADFNGVDQEGKVIKEYKHTMNWCHAKFYNFDNLWNKEGIHFIKDIHSHEDIAICTQVSCALSKFGSKPLTYFPFAAYAWTDNPKSLTHAEYKVEGEDEPRYFLEVYFKDYLTSTGYIYLEQFKQHKIKMIYAVTRCIEVLTYCYFYTQGFQFAHPDNFLKANLAIAGEYEREVMKTFNITVDQIYNAICENNGQIYRTVRPMADPGSGAYVPIQSLKEWIRLTSRAYLKNPERHILSDITLDLGEIS